MFLCYRWQLSIQHGPAGSVASWPPQRSQFSSSAGEIGNFLPTKGSARLREVQLIIKKYHECQECFHHYTETTEICAGDLKKIQVPSKGDSGGPLVCGNKAYGVVAYGRNRTMSSGVFTKVVYFLPWISRNMRLL
ncbi:granzyme E-like [Apodemus sylvaticus]|uniref:granzyme E-like n=1 Tax=Apodemus sylvaticus TaxID=10129 RepID=UPI0022439CAA|nr:granzyme E-like [Apodemus sylvaticus]